MSFAETLRRRTFEFAAQAVTFCQRLPQSRESWEIGRQLLRASMSVAANYRAACRGRSRREFIAKLGVAVEEADETVFWLDLLAATGLVDASGLESLRQEARELRAVLARSHRTARENTRLRE